MSRKIKWGNIRIVYYRGNYGVEQYIPCRDERIYRWFGCKYLLIKFLTALIFCTNFSRRHTLKKTKFSADLKSRFSVPQ